jgi:hypothetical protein
MGAAPDLTGADMTPNAARKINDPRDWIEANADELSAAMHAIRSALKERRLNHAHAYEVVSAMRIIVEIGAVKCSK